LLFGIEYLLGLASLTPLMQALDYSIKFHQARNCFNADMLVAMKISLGELYSQYVDLMCVFTHDHIFKGFKDIVQFNVHIRACVIEWVPYMNTNDENLSIRVANPTIMMHVKLKASGDYKMITATLL
jgi:hypothetical protein